MTWLYWESETIIVRITAGQTDLQSALQSQVRTSVIVVWYLFMFWLLLLIYFASDKSDLRTFRLYVLIVVT